MLFLKYKSVIAHNAMGSSLIEFDHKALNVKQNTKYVLSLLRFFI